MKQSFNVKTAAPLARTLIRTARDAALGSVAATGAPHVSHVAVATLADGAPVVAVSDLALHTQHLRRDPRASLLFVADEGESGDTNTRARISLVGKVTEVADRAAARARILRRHPDAFYVDFPDFRIMRFEIEASHLVAGFGRIIDLDPHHLLAPADLVPQIAAMDAGACEHMDADHADALALIATRIAGGRGGPWRTVGLDPEGIDLESGGRIVRAEFDAPIGDGGALRVALKRLADRARAAG